MMVVRVRRADAPRAELHLTRKFDLKHLWRADWEKHMAPVLIRGVRKAFGSVEVLHGVDVNIGAIGRAIVRDPQVFLFDEPLSTLDAKLRVAMRTEVKELLHDGVVEQIGAPFELYDHPNNIFVAGSSARRP